MFLILKILSKELIEANKTFNRDERTSHLPLLGSPWPMACVVLLYILFVKKWGPWLMKRRQPYNVDALMQFFNLVQICANLYIFKESVQYSYMQPYFNLSCQGYNPQDRTPGLMRLRYAGYVYYISKYLDLFDTLFFVLRKKYNQISFLHVYHHAIMIFGVWVYNTLLFGSHHTAVGVINSFIHVCMYLYYFLAALKLQSLNLKPWKKCMTQLQIIQFCLLCLHFLWPILNNWCNLDMFWIWVVFTQNLFMLVLFLDFYYKAYVRKSRKDKASINQSSKDEVKLD